MSEHGKRFDRFIEVVLKNEGGYVNDKHDPGGETKFGISKRSYPDLDIAKLSRHDAIDIYFKDYWNPLYDEVPDKHLAFKLFDLGINMGVKRVVKALQGVLISHGFKIAQDGIFGRKTLEALKADNISADRAFYQVIEETYKNIVKRDSDKKRYLRGWLNRLHKFPTFEGLV